MCEVCCLENERGRNIKLTSYDFKHKLRHESRINEKLKSGYVLNSLRKVVLGLVEYIRNNEVM
jgi:hypothetical protein